LDQFVVVFVDDILIYSRIAEEHSHHLRVFLEVLRKNELHVKLKKHEFWLEKIVFLGHAVSKEGIYVDPQKISYNMVA